MNYIFDIINVPFGYVIRICYALVHNYAIALLLFAVLIKILLFPLGIKQQRNQVRQAQLRPREMAIRKRYAGRTDKATQQKLNEEIMKFYQQENFNPAAGCLPLLIELPIVMSLYQIVTNPLRYICNMSADVINAISAKITELGGVATTQIKMISFMKTDMSAFADILPAGFTVSQFPDFTSLGGLMDLSNTPNLKVFDLMMLIPVFTFICVFASMKITRKFTYQPVQQDGGGGDTALSMKIMDYTMPLFSVWITFTVPAIVGLYWIYQNLLGALRQYILYKLYPIPVFTEEDYKQAERELNGKAVTKASKKKVRSLHRIDEEDQDDAPRQSDAGSGSGGNGEKNGLIAPAKLKDDRKDAVKAPKDKANQADKTNKTDKADKADKTDKTDKTKDNDEKDINTNDENEENAGGEPDLIAGKDGSGGKGGEGSGGGRK